MVVNRTNTIGFHNFNGHPDNITTGGQAANRGAGVPESKPDITAEFPSQKLTRELALATPA
jgi:hypothetical protein